MVRSVHETLKASKFEREDAFSNIPENVITNILDRLTIRDAVRTCILAKNWRFNWTLLTQLVFDEEFSAHLPQPEGVDGDYDGRDISRILLHLKGPITKFALYIPNYKLEELYLDFQDFRFSGAGARLMPVETTFPALKTLTLHLIDFSSAIMLHDAFEPIWGSPNLQTLKITARYKDVVPPPVFAFCSSEVSNSSGLRQLQLRTVVLESFRGSENEIFLIKCLLARSPFLKKMVIRVDSSQVFGGENGTLIFAAKLLKLHRASTVAEVDFHWF